MVALLGRYHIRCIQQENVDMLLDPLMSKILIIRVHKIPNRPNRRNESRYLEVNEKLHINDRFCGLYWVMSPQPFPEPSSCCIFGRKRYRFEQTYYRVDSQGQKTKRRRQLIRRLVIKGYPVQGECPPDY